MKQKNFYNTIIAICAISLMFSLSACTSGEKPIEDQQIGEFAPKDAYLDGSKHPYYGSENPWNRRFFYEHIKNYYKRRGQREMLDLVEGRPQETLKYCQELLASDPKDLESLFNLAVAQAHLNMPDKAMQTVERAVKAGLPFERFLAGPRDVLMPLVQLKEFQQYAKKFTIELLHGPLLGSVTDTSARFWVRTLHEVPVQIRLFVDGNLSQPVASGENKTLKESDYTAIIKVNDLQPDTRYRYNVYIDGKPCLQNEMPAFTTYPTPGSQVEFSVGFGGGAGYVPSSERMWDVILSHHPSAFLFMGDNVYMNMPQQPNGFHQYTYYRRQSRPEFRRLVANTSIYAIWDDHDSATDDVWLGPYRDKPAWKMPLLGVFRQNWNNPFYGDAEWPGCWFNFTIGDVDFFMLDGRTYRTNPYDKNPTMLGPVQKAWLLKSLQESRATIRVIASPVPWALATKGEARDTWNGFKSEREEIFNFIAEHKINGVILLSADRHRSDAWRIDREAAYPLYEFESSRLTNQHFHELMPAALFGYNAKQSFGFLRFNTTLPDPEITYQIISIDNEIIHTFTVRLSEISFAK